MKRAYWIFFIILLAAGDAYAGRLVKMATAPWAPYYSPDLPNGGYIPDITREAFKRVGYDFEVEYMPWKRALEMSRKGRYDGILGVFYSEERGEYFIFSLPNGPAAGAESGTICLL